MKPLTEMCAWCSWLMPSRTRAATGEVCCYLTSFPTVMAAITFFTASFLFSFFSLLSSAFSSKISPGRKNRLRFLGEEKGLALERAWEWLFILLACCSHKPNARGSCQTSWRTRCNKKQGCNTQNDTGYTLIMRKPLTRTTLHVAALPLSEHEITSL